MEDQEQAQPEALSCDLRDRWVEALRSGKYKQGRGFLNKKGAFCCLGVLCEVAGIEKYEDLNCLNDYKVNFYNVPFQEDRHLPNNILGLDSDWCSRLAGLNDRGGSFDIIASLIENEVPCI